MEAHEEEIRIRAYGIFEQRLLAGDPGADGERRLTYPRIAYLT